MKLRRLKHRQSRATRLFRHVDSFPLRAQQAMLRSACVNGIGAVNGFSFTTSDTFLARS